MKTLKEPIGTRIQGMGQKEGRGWCSVRLALGESKARANMLLERETKKSAT